MRLGVRTTETPTDLPILQVRSPDGPEDRSISRPAGLTPYLGQLRAIMDALKETQDSDAVLNDLDSYDLVRAGLVSESDAKAAKKQIRLATIGWLFTPQRQTSKLSYS